MNIPETNSRRIVIAGGGFGGLQLAKKLKNTGFQIVLIDQHNYHTFQPLLYQVATAGLEPDSIAYPLRKIFTKYKNVHFRLGEIGHVDTANKRIHSSIGSLHYDVLIIATGSTTNFFGMDEIERQAMSMKSIPESLDIRSLVLQNFEQALLTRDLNEREALMNVVIVGGGPTGVELAGALAELKRHVLPRDYAELDVRQMNIHVIEAAPRLLAAMSEQASEKSYEFLEDLGVKIWLNARVQNYTNNVVESEGGKPIRTQTLIWAAGVKGCPIEGIPADKISRSNRIEVDAYNRVQGLDNVYAIGDCAMMVTDDTSQGHPMLAQVAMQQGDQLAKNLLLEQKGKKMQPFTYKDRGSMATIGRNRAVVDLPRFRFQGFLAWFVWMGVHILQLVGFRNKLVVMMNWMYNYLRYARDIRLIIRPYRRKDLN